MHNNNNTSKQLLIANHVLDTVFTFQKRYKPGKYRLKTKLNEESQGKVVD